MKELKKLLSLYNSGTVFTAVDTETTGLRPDSERIIEIGAVRFSINGVEDTFSTLIYPEKTLSPLITSLTGITYGMLESQPLFTEIADDFISFIEGSKLIAHNAGFDMRFLNMELLRAGKKELKSPAVPAVDTLRYARKAFPELGKYNLPFLAEKLCINPGNAHRALDDALTCMNLFLKCISRAELLQDQ